MVGWASGEQQEGLLLCLLALFSALSELCRMGGKHKKKNWSTVYERHSQHTTQGLVDRKHIFHICNSA